jgi:molybdopterin-guanine dinucleotide biosynthesis protein A
LIQPGAAEGFVLAGGQSSRMGTEKALVELAGQPLIVHALTNLREAGFNARIAGARVELSRFAPVVADVETNRGPLAGVCSALGSAEAEFAAFLSVDAPLLPGSLLAYLVRHARVAEAVVTLASVNGFAQTFPCVIRRDALPALDVELRAGRAGCFAAFRAAARQENQSVAVLPVELLAQAGQIGHDDGIPPVWWFMNVNTPDDLQRAETCISRARRVS